MQLGLIHINMEPMSRPDALVQAARAAEQAGFDSVWAGGAPDPAPTRRLPPVRRWRRRTPALDSLLATDLGRRAHGHDQAWPPAIVILPQRNPVVLAKQGGDPWTCCPAGRVMFGRRRRLPRNPSFPRGRRETSPSAARSTDEYLDAMRGAVVNDEHPEFPRAGSPASAASTPAPRPVQRPIPLIVGGATAPRPYRRAVCPRPRLVRLLADARAGRRVAGPAWPRPAGQGRPARRARRARDQRGRPRGQMSAERAGEFRRDRACTASSCWRPPDTDGPRPDHRGPAPRQVAGLR